MKLGEPQVLLSVVGVEKCFSHNRVLRGVSFQLAVGQVLGLVGENGAGKSTLMNILGGNLQPDAGAMQMAGAPYQPHRPADATRAGLAFVHQELNLFPNLSVAENLFIQSFPRGPVGGWPWIDRRQTHARAAAMLAQVGLSISTETCVEALSAGERQLVEIAKALSIEARLIILDEPTTSLSAGETAHLFHLLRFLRARGVAMIYVSHNLNDVLDLCDSLVVLRDGEVAGGGATTDFSLEKLVGTMVGRPIRQLYPARQVKPGSEIALEVRGLSQPGVVRNISFQLRQREVLGLAGLMGSGRSELARILFGLDPCARGEVILSGRQIGRLNPRRRIGHGLAFLTEDRRADGLCLEASVRDNIALAALPSFARTPLRLIHWKRLREAVAAMRKAIRLSPSASDDQPVRTLSGGNQQKVIFARWLLGRPRVLILDEPTRGIDVGAKVEVYTLINQLAAQGSALLVISSEIDELIGLCDRILVMNRGELRDELPRPAFSRERILRAALLGEGERTRPRAASNP